MFGGEEGDVPRPHPNSSPPFKRPPTAPGQQMPGLLIYPLATPKILAVRASFSNHAERGRTRRSEGALAGRDKTLASCNDPTTAPAHDRVDLSDAWYRISPRRPPRAIRSF
jgi:hypothetical protein